MNGQHYTTKTTTANTVLKKNLTQKNTLLKNAQANAESKFFKGVWKNQYQKKPTFCKHRTEPTRNYKQETITLYQD